MEPNSTAPVAVSSTLMTTIRTIAQEEHRTADEPVQDAVELYIQNRQLQRLVLSADDQHRIADALINPPEPAPALRRSEQRRHDLFGSE